MINASTKLKIALEKNTRIYVSGYLFKDEENQIDLVGSDFMANTITFNQSSSKTTSFDIGGAYIQKCTFTLNNFDGKFDNYDFYNSKIFLIFAVLDEKGNPIEHVSKGKFIVVDYKSRGNVIDITSYDYFYILQKPISELKMSETDKTKDYIFAIERYMNCTISSTDFKKIVNYPVPYPIKNTETTIFELLDSICALQGLVAYMEGDYLRLKWYEKNPFGNNYDGGNLEDYSSGDILDGGNLVDYSSGDSADGGNFKTTTINLYANKTLELDTEDVQITGIRTIIDKDGDNEEEIGFAGSEGYVIVVRNQLLERGYAQTVADNLFEKVNGLKFRPFSAQTLSNFLYEPLDPVRIIDRKQNIYYSYITNINYKVGEWMSISCTCENKTKNKYSGLTKIDSVAIETKKEIESQLSTYDKTVKRFTDMAINALGFHTTEEKQDDESKILYMHDKKELSESKVIYKMSANGFFISSDGGKTYTAGFDSDGNALLNVLSVIGINFDWAHGGQLKLGGTSNGNGELYVYDNDNFEIGSWDKNGIQATRKTEETTEYAGKTYTKYQTIRIIPNSNNAIELSYYWMNEEGGKLTDKGLTMLLSFDGYIYSNNPKTKVYSIMGDGNFVVYNSKTDKRLGALTGMTYKNSEDNMGFVARDAKSIIFACGDNEGNQNAVYIINNGLNPNTATERHIFFGNSRFLGKVLIEAPKDSSGNYDIGISTYGHIIASRNVQGSYLYSKGNIKAEGNIEGKGISSTANIGASGSISADGSISGTGATFYGNNYGTGATIYGNAYSGSMHLSGNSAQYYGGYRLSVVGGSACIDGDVVGGSFSQFSDRRFKNTIIELDENKSTDFIYNLKPCEYIYNQDVKNIVHHGFIAQDVEELLKKSSWGLCEEQDITKTIIEKIKTLSEDDESTEETVEERKVESKILTINYMEIIADLVKTVQSQNNRIKALESKLGL